MSLLKEEGDLKWHLRRCDDPSRSSQALTPHPGHGPKKSVPRLVPCSQAQGNEALGGLGAGKRTGSFALTLYAAVPVGRSF